MAKKIQCDYCERIIELQEAKRIEIYQRTSFTTIKQCCESSFDICDECLKKHIPEGDNQ